MLVGLFSSCEGIGDETLQIDSYAPEFEVSYDPLPKREYMRGETITITTCVKNISGKDLTYNAVIDSYYPTIELYSQIEGGEVSTKISHEPIETVSGSEEFTANAGQVGKKSFTFIIPENAVLGPYAIALNYRGNVCTYNDALMILDNTSQNENAKYQYSPISVSAGGESVNPIRVGTSTQIQQADGTCMFGCDGLGVWRYFGEEDTDFSTFPLLVLEDKPKLTLPENTRLEGVRVYDLNANEIGGYYASLKALEALPAGEYVVVIKAVYDTSALSPTEYEITNYDDFFRLSIPQNTKINEFDYSPVRIACGGVEVIPIRAFLYSSYHKDGEGIEADGLGAAGLFYDKTFSPEELPALTLNSNVVSYCPAGVTIGKAKVFDLEYNQLHLDMEYMWDFSKLPAGEYIIAFDEKAVEEHTTYGYESLFRLIVPENTVGSFSFSTIRETYKSGDPGVKTDGFKNISEHPVTTTPEAAERAKNECTIEYDTITAQYDADEKVWSVTFSTRGTLGGCQTVYLNDKGVTLLIVYGE